jgi:hypothetical protein
MTILQFVNEKLAMEYWSDRMDPIEPVIDNALEDIDWRNEAEFVSFSLASVLHVATIELSTQSLDITILWASLLPWKIVLALDFKLGAHCTF